LKRFAAMLKNMRTLALIGGTIFSLLASHATLAAASGLGNCAPSDVAKTDSAPYTLSGSWSAAYFKAGVPCYGPFTSDTVVNVDGVDCFWVQFSATNITVTKVGPGPTCKDISHIEGVVATAPAPTPTPTPQPFPGTGIG
jgi:hypothetical protein